MRASSSFNAPKVGRIGIEEYNWWNECLHGVGRAGLATVFPQAIGLAATFDVDLVKRVATAISDEARAKHHLHAMHGDHGIYKGLTYWTPNINIFRDPRWGRGHETYGECPYLTSRIGVAFVQGLQGDDPIYLKLVATPKHFAVHSGPEKGRHAFDATVSKRDLYETYLPAFRATVIEGKAHSVMGAYNRLNGEPCCASPFLLEKVLRHDWGFEGYVVSDCGALSDLHEHHKVTQTAAESAALALNNGMDLCCGKDYRHLFEAVNAGLTTEAAVDRSLLRLLVARLKLGMFDPPERVEYSRIPYSVVACDEHRALSLQAARQSIVLLKNADQTLPLARATMRIAVIGPNADAPLLQLGNYYGTPSYIVTPLEAIRTRAGKEAKVTFNYGCTHLTTEGVWLGTPQRGFVEAVQAAKDAELAIVCLGLSPTIEGEEGDAMNSDAGGDRTKIELPGVQLELLQAIAATGTPIVLVLMGGSAMAVPWAQENVAAILQQFYPGQDGGTALAEVLFGDFNPCGRLPFTVYRATSDLPAFEDYSMENRTYRFFAGTPLYPFGFGLSYTRYEYGALRAELVGQSLIATVQVRNAGDRAGIEIGQLYLRHVRPPVRAPRRQLIGIRRIELRAGETMTMEFRIDREQLMLVDDAGEAFWPGGEIELTVGGARLAVALR